MENKIYAFTGTLIGEVSSEMTRKNISPEDQKQFVNRLLDLISTYDIQEVSDPNTIGIDKNDHEENPLSVIKRCVNSFSGPMLSPRVEKAISSLRL